MRRGYIGAHTSHGGEVRIDQAAIDTLPSTSGDSFLRDLPEFSLVRGGPLYQLLRRSHLANDALGLTNRRIIIFSLFCWLPLLVFSALEGKVPSASAAVPFWLDLEVHVRFLVAMPFLIGAELVVHRRMWFLIRQFIQRRLIPESAVTQFHAAIASAFRLRNSMVAELLLLSFVYIVGIMIVWRHYVALDTATWYATPSVEGSKLSLAGIWYGYVSLPIFQFLLLRWYFRMFIWARFLWQVSRIDLCLVPTHPDRVGGLGFLSDTVYGFAPLLIAHGVLLAGLIGNRIYHLGAALPSFMLEIVILVIFTMCVVLGPLLVFAPQLAKAKWIGKGEYGTLAERYVREFDAKWLRGSPANEPLIGSADLQSLADLANSFEIVRTMRITPFTKEAIIQLAVVTVAPIAPLVLSMMSLEEILKKLMGILF
jgi:hypothetical protein